MGNHRTWRWAIAISALVLTTACGGQGSPHASTSRPSPTAGTMTPASSPATSSTPAIDPNIPAAARAQTPAGAEAFTRYYFDQINRAWSKPDDTALDPLYLSSCATCSAIDGSAAKFVATKRRYRDTPMTLTSIGTLSSPSDNTLQVATIGVQHKSAVIDQTGTVVESIPETPSRFILTLSWRGNGWAVSKMQVSQ